jgi:hypothetical protein
VRPVAAEVDLMRSGGADGVSGSERGIAIELERLHAFRQFTCSG